MYSQTQNPLHGASQPILTLLWTMELQLGASHRGAVGDAVKVVMTPVDLMAEEMHLLDLAPVRKVMK